MAQKKFWHFFDALTNFLAFLAGILLLLVTLFVSYSVIVRYLNFKPPVWVLQFTEYALLWVTFLGAAWLLRLGGHIRIDTLVSYLSPGVRKCLDIIVGILGCLVCIVIVWFGTQKNVELFQKGIMDVKGVTVPKYPFFFIIPFGGLMLLVQFIRNVFTRAEVMGEEEER